MNYINEEHMQEHIERLSEYLNEIVAPANSKVIDALISVVQELVDKLTPTITKMLKEISVIYEAAINSYPNKRVLHLAKYHPKERIRKKNMRRILKWCHREIIKCEITNRK